MFSNAESLLISILQKRLSVKTNLKLAKLWLDRKEYVRLSKVCFLSPPLFKYQGDIYLYSQLIRDLHAATVEGSDDQSQRGTQLLEIYALEIQMYNETRNFKKLKVLISLPSYHASNLTRIQEIYNATNDVRSAIPHPRIMGVIKECGGKMWMGERNYISSLQYIVLLTIRRSMESSKRRFLRILP
jgi:COP9 signalosome complex subunit 2